MARGGPADAIDHWGLPFLLYGLSSKEGVPSPVTASKTLRSSRAQCRRVRIGYEIQDHVRDLCGIVTKPGKMVSSIKFNELRAWNVFRQETATLDADGRILGPVQNQGRHADRRAGCRR